MFDLAAPIVPGKSAAGITLGQLMEEVLDHQQPIEVHTTPGGSVKYCFNQVDLWARDGKVFQIGVKLDYQGKVQDVIGIGATISDVQSAFGNVIEDEEDNLIVSNMEGWCFETEIWQRGQKIEHNLSSRITDILVYVDE